MAGLDRRADLVEGDCGAAGVRRLAEHGIGARPLLFLDVDGTLLPFARTARQTDDEGNPLLARLDPEHGRHSAPALLRRIDPRRGLTDADYTAIAEWLLKDDSTGVTPIE